jgi:hypothetical protein
MEILEVEQKERLSREEVAARLRNLEVGSDKRELEIELTW